MCISAMSDDRTVNVAQAMQLAGVSRRTITYWITQGRVQVQRNGRDVRIVKASIPAKRPQGRKPALHAQMRHTIS